MPQSQIIGLIFAASSAFLFALNVAGQQPGKLIETIDFQGNRRFTDEEMLKHIKTRPGEPFDEAQVQQDLQSLLKLGLFSAPPTKVLTEAGVRGGVNVIFKILELPLIVKLDLNNLRYVSEKDVLTELRERQAAVKVGAPCDFVKLHNARRIIAEYLGNRGYVNAKVEIWTEETSPTTVGLTFVIDELPDVDEDDCCEDDAAPEKLI